MKMWVKMTLAALMTGTTMGSIAGDATAQVRPRDDQSVVHRGRATGKLLSPQTIERQYVPAMERDGATYLGFVFDSASSIYTLKFLLNGKVIWIYVDAQSGKSLGRSGQ